MSVFAKVNIKSGARCFQDFRSYIWPPSQYKDGFRLAGVPDNQIFVAQKRISSEGHVEWHCKAEGAGVLGHYGNGGIIVLGSELDFITPMLGYDPSENKDEFHK